MVKGKRAWLRILEAVIAILLISGLLLVVYSRQTTKADTSQAAYELQSSVLNYISENEILREYALNNQELELNNGIRQKIPQNFDFNIKICDITAPCKLDNIESEIFVQDKIISANSSTYSPKKIRLFIWQK